MTVDTDDSAEPAAPDEPAPHAAPDEPVPPAETGGKTWATKMRAQPQCPECGGFNCRKSHWHSSDEKRNHLESSPYRCLDCSHRFLRPRQIQVLETRWAPAAIAVLVIGMVIAAIAMSMMEPDFEGLPDSLSSILDDPKVRQAAADGDPAAQFRLGQALFLDSARSSETSAQAVHWLETAAKSGNVDAMIYLGRQLRAGVGILQDFAKASLWIRTAAVRGHPEGMLEMGRLYRDGVDVEKSPIKAYAWFNRAAAARNIDAVRERDAIAQLMTSEDIREAQRQSAQLARESETNRGQVGGQGARN
ncbi:MAG: sel1 repeat family protein [Candidatus Accumulibacter sp.]|jgi:hypothetical protein|nr:sel1 repeat family protein [Accumulibacter sp.]